MCNNVNYNFLIWAQLFLTNHSPSQLSFLVFTSHSQRREVFRRRPLELLSGLRSLLAPRPLFPFRPDLRAASAVPSVTPRAPGAPALRLKFGETLSDLFVAEVSVDIDAVLGVISPAELIALDDVQLVPRLLIERGELLSHLGEFLALNPAVVLEKLGLVNADFDLTFKLESVAQGLKNGLCLFQLVGVDRGGDLELRKLLDEAELQLQLGVVLVVEHAGPVSLAALLLLPVLQQRLIYALKLLHLPFRDKVRDLLLRIASRLNFRLSRLLLSSVCLGTVKYQVFTEINICEVRMLLHSFQLLHLPLFLLKLLFLLILKLLFLPLSLFELSFSLVLFALLIAFLLFLSVLLFFEISLFKGLLSLFKPHDIPNELLLNFIVDHLRVVLFLRCQLVSFDALNLFSDLGLLMFNLVELLLVICLRVFNMALLLLDRFNLGVDTVNHLLDLW